MAQPVAGKTYSSFISSQRAITVGFVWLLFFLLCVLPTLYMIGSSFIGADGSLGFANYKRLVLDARQRGLFLNSALIGLGTAVFATLIGAPLGFVFARVDLPAKRLLRFVFIIPLVIPPYVLALAWIYLGGTSGLLAELFGRDLLSGLTYSLSGTIIVLTFAFYPISMLATEAAARRIDGHLEEAALIVAGPRRVLARIILPLIAPGVVAAALIIFVLALSEFGVPGMLRVPVFTTEIFTAFAALYDFGAATSLALPLLVIVLAAGGLAKGSIGERLLTTRRSVHPPLSFALSRWLRLLALALSVLGCSLVASPLIVLVNEVGNVERMLPTLRQSQSAIASSLWLSVCGATLVVVVGFLLGYERARTRLKAKGLFDLMMIGTFAVPGAVVGIGLIGLWNQPGLLGATYQSPLIIVIGYMARFVPLAALILAAAARQVPISNEEAAQLSGASWLRTLARIVLPQMKAGLFAAWVVAFIFAFGELGTTILVAPPGESTLPIRIYTLIANTPSSELASLSLMQIGIILIPLSVLSFFTGKEREP
jgi:iron(III) transport system permease protein